MRRDGRAETLGASIECGARIELPHRSVEVARASPRGAHVAPRDHTVEIQSGLSPVVDRPGPGSYAPRPLCQNSGASHEPFRAPLAVSQRSRVPARDEHACAARTTSSARWVRRNCLRSCARELHALTLLAKSESSAPHDAACIGYRRLAVSSRCVRSRPHPTLIPIPRLRFIGPLPPSNDRASALEVASRRRSGRALCARAIPRRAIRDESSLRLHGRSDIPCS